jgi:hypothetical protein
VKVVDQQKVTPPSFWDGGESTHMAGSAFFPVLPYLLRQSLALNIYHVFQYLGVDLKRHTNHHHLFQFNSNKD